jgi:hypothetical protein
LRAWTGVKLNLLISYAYLPGAMYPWLPSKLSSWMMDSGAFTAHTTGREIDLQKYIRQCQWRIATDTTLTEIIGLDAIGDHRTTMRNCDVMTLARIPTIATVHYGATVDEIADARDYAKVAIGGLVGRSAQEKRRFCERVFSVLWPKRMHALGVFSEALLMAFPFESADCADWVRGPAWGHMRSMPGFDVPRGAAKDLSSEIRFFLDLENRLATRWRKTLSEVKL